MEEILKLSRQFWDGMMHQNDEEMRSVADPNCMFVHIGANADLDQEIKYYTTDTFHPTNIDIHKQDVRMFNDTAVVLTNVDYGLLLDGKDTTHHFYVTEVYVNKKLVQFSFTALVY